LKRREFVKAGGALVSLGLLMNKTTPLAAAEAATHDVEYQEAQAEADAALSKYVDLARFEDGWVNAGSHRMHFKFNRLLRDTGTKVILVHGLGLSYRYMLPTAQALMDEYDVYAPDLPGFGDSDKPDTVLDMNGLGDSLAAWLRATKLRGRLALLGNSMGCQIIAAALERHPAVAHAAVLQGPITPPDERGVFIQFVRWRQNVRNNPPEMKPISRADYMKCGYRRVWRTFLLSLDDRMEDRLPRIAQPTLVVRGERDPICNDAWARQVTELLPRGKLVHIPRVAHTLVIISPRELAEVATRFLKDV